MNLVFDPVNPSSAYLTEIIRISSHLESQNQIDADVFVVGADNFGVIFDYVEGNNNSNPAAQELLTPYPPALSAGQTLVFVAAPAASIRHLVIISHDAASLKQFVNWFLAQTSMPSKFNNQAFLYEDDVIIDSGLLSTLFAPATPQIVVNAQRTVPAGVESGVDFPVTIEFDFNGGTAPTALGIKETLPAGLSIVSSTGTVSGNTMTFALASLFNSYTATGGTISYTAQITQDADLSGNVEWSVSGSDVTSVITDAGSGAGVSTISLSAAAAVCGDGNCDGGETSTTCAVDCAPVCNDADNDGFSIDGGDCGVIDCDDADSAIRPGATDIPGDGIDQDCSGADAAVVLTCSDGDDDGFSIDGGDCGPIDCEDQLPGVFPGAVEDCNDNVDNNCDGKTDKQDTATCPPAACSDGDGDGYGIGADISQCSASTSLGDCDDSDSAINPGESENTEVLCFDGQDNNCDANVDAADNGCTDFCDVDQDGAVKQGCAGTPIDCDDADDGNFPGNVESCDQVDNNCDTVVDEGDVCVVPEPDDMYTNVAKVRSKDQTAIIFIGPSGADRRDAAIGAGKMRVSVVGVSTMDPDQDVTDICGQINSLDADADVIFGWGGKFALPLAKKYYCKSGETPGANGCAADIETQSCEIRMFRDNLCGKNRKIVLVAGFSPTDTRLCTNVFKKQEQFQNAMANSDKGIKVKRKPGSISVSGEPTTVDVTAAS